MEIGHEIWRNQARCYECGTVSEHKTGCKVLAQYLRDQANCVPFYGMQANNAAWSGDASRQGYVPPPPRPLMDQPEAPSFWRRIRLFIANR